MPRAKRPSRVRTGRHPRRPVRYLSVIGWVHANMEIVSLDDPRFAEWLQFMDPEAYQVVRDRIDRERAVDLATAER